MNSGSHTAAEAAAYHIPAQLEPEVARKLLTTAALRQHVSAVHHMSGLAVMQQHADAPTVHSVLVNLVAPANSPHAWCDDVNCFAHDSQAGDEDNCPADDSQGYILRSICILAVCAMPAAAQLSADRLAQLLLAAVQSRAALQGINRLCRLPAARQLSSDQVADLLDAAITLDEGFCTAHFCRLPAAYHLSADGIVRLLQQAVDLEQDSMEEDVTTESVRALCGLPGAQQISSDMTLQLLQACCCQTQKPDHTSGPIHALLQQLPAAGAIGKADAEQLLMLACQFRSNRVAESLGELPALQQLGVAELLRLMLAAAEHQCASALTTLCGLEVAQQLNSEDLAQVIIQATSRQQSSSTNPTTCQQARSTSSR
jgi:hypothetical protein